MIEQFFYDMIVASSDRERLQWLITIQLLEIVLFIHLFWEENKGNLLLPKILAA